jgi:hypothetical protein
MMAAKGAKKSIADHEEELNKLKTEIKLRKGLEVKRIAKEYIYSRSSAQTKQIERNLVMLLGNSLMRFRSKQEGVRAHSKAMPSACNSIAIYILSIANI